ncbi:hypothetical protein [Acinetobacter sp. CE-15]|uniref:hypothetical protein n=1 Tax=Acinetobacter sp. CE-15 TaxID=3425693 RepID=UPI003DA23A69
MFYLVGIGLGPIRASTVITAATGNGFKQKRVGYFAVNKLSFNIDPTVSGNSTWKFGVAIGGSYGADFEGIIVNNMKKIIAIIFFIILLSSVTIFVQNNIHGQKMNNILKLFFKKIISYNVNLVIFRNTKFGK